MTNWRTIAVLCMSLELSTDGGSRFGRTSVELGLQAAEPATKVTSRYVAEASRIADSTVDEVMRRVAAYVSAYGQHLSAVVAVEKYTHHDYPFGGRPGPIQVLAEFALVKGTGAVRWTGYRDVIEINGESIPGRGDRILKILSNDPNPIEEAARVTEESARFKLGPISRGFHAPTTALFFFSESKLPRFAFTRKGAGKIDRVDTIEIGFREVVQPTLVTTGAGKDVPCEGTLWVIPSDGTIVRMLLRFRAFSGTLSFADDSSATPSSNVPGNPSSSVELEQSVAIDVTYRPDNKIGMWVPTRVSEEYHGGIPRSFARPFLGNARSTTAYTEYQRFGTSAAMIRPKK